MLVIDNIVFEIFLMVFSILFVLLFLLLVFPTANAKKEHSSHIYTPGHQFPVGSEHLPLPRILTYSIFMGKVKYPHLFLTLESMRLNPGVKFVLINVVEDEISDAAEIRAIVRKQNVPNFHLHVLTMTAFSSRIKEKLHIDVVFNNTWFYKMTDYKPTLAYLFPEHFDSSPSGATIKYWAYVDMDLVWGNFSRFSHLFQGDYAVITSDFQGASGVGMFFVNEDWTKR